ncbi:PDF receptor-like [Glandiceps talaboti]
MTSQEDCLASADDATLSTGLYCPPYWEPSIDSGPWLCWPKTEVNSSVYIRCPEHFAFDTSHSTSRFCSIDGEWANLDVAACLNPAILDLFKDFFKNSSDADLTFVQAVITGARILEIVGYSISLAALVIAFFILCYFRSLQCDRTSIHKQLLLSLLIRTVLDIILHVDNIYRLQVMQNGSKYDTIGKVEGLCETFECFRQYTRFCVFTWMFVEGFYLNGMITAAVFRKPNFKLYHFVGWILPIVPILSWAVTMHYKSTTQCWFGYAHSPYYWIIEAPRLLILIINLGFLINIIRILVTKLRESNTSETQQLTEAFFDTVSNRVMQHKVQETELKWGNYAFRE